MSSEYLTKNKTLVREVQIHIRLLSVEDFEILAAFFKKNNTPEVRRYFHPFSLSTETAYDITHVQRRDKFYAAFSDMIIVGFCMLRGWDEGYDIPSYGILLDRHYQGQGIGRIMTEFAIQEAKNLGCEALRLSVYASHKIAVRLYKSLGFISMEDKTLPNAQQEDKILVMYKGL